MKGAVAGRSSFTAHGGMRDLPRGAVPLRQEPPAPVERRSRTGLLLVLLAMAVALLANQHADALAGYLNRPVRTVLMENPLQRADERDVRAVLASHVQDGFFALDVQAIKIALEADPWIEQATVTRVWPDTLSVAIREELAIARWGDDALLNQYGEIFVPELMEEDPGMPHLIGPENMQRRVMEQYQAFSQMLASSGLRIRRLELSERGSWALQLHNDITVTIGRSDVVERLQRFVTLHDRLLYAQMEEIEALDLRYHSGISIRKKENLPEKVALK